MLDTTGYHTKALEQIIAICIEANSSSEALAEAVKMKVSQKTQVRRSPLTTNDRHSKGLQQIIFMGAEPNPRPKALDKAV